MLATNSCCLLHTSLLGVLLSALLPAFGISFKKDLRSLIELHFPTSTQQTDPWDDTSRAPWSFSLQFLANLCSFLHPFPLFWMFFREQELLGAAAEAAEAACARAGTPAPGSAAPWESPGHGAVVPPNFPQSPSFCTFPNTRLTPSCGNHDQELFINCYEELKKEKRAIKVRS